VTVKNAGSHAGVDIVQLYAEQPVTHSVIVAPARRLVGFKRVTLAAGQSKVVRIPVALGALARTPGDIESSARPRVQAGDYVLHVGFSGGPSAPFTITP
jgi:beta-glucosidase